MRITRRSMLGGLTAGVASAAAAVPAGAQEAPLNKHQNAEFYKPGGAFDATAAKEAYYEMMRHYGYPIPARLRGDDFWTLDFALGKFIEVGMAGIFWINNKKDNYFGHEIYLLPGQMIPEHKHVMTADAEPKMEGWHVRHGWVYIYGEGAPTPGVEARIPQSHRECAVARTERKLLPGEVGALAGPEQWHWMCAGPEGAIVTEYATYHDGAGLRFSHPNVKM